MPNITFSGSSFNIKPLETGFYNHWEDVIRSLKKLQAHESAADVRIHCKGSQTLRSSKFPLMAASKLLKSIFDSGCECPISTFTLVEYDLVCHDFEAFAMLKVLELLYTGSVKVDCADQPLVLEMSAILECFGMSQLLQVFETIMVEKRSQENFSDQPMMRRENGNWNDESQRDEAESTEKNSDVVNFKCGKCQKEFICEAAFMRHEMKHANSVVENAQSSENFYKLRLRETLRLDPSNQLDNDSLIETTEFMEMMQVSENSQSYDNQTEETMTSSSGEEDSVMTTAPADETDASHGEPTTSSAHAEILMEKQSMTSSENESQAVPLTSLDVPEVDNTTECAPDDEDSSLVIDFGNIIPPVDEDSGQIAKEPQDADGDTEVANQVGPVELELIPCSFCHKKYRFQADFVRHLCCTHFKLDLIKLNGGEKSVCQFCSKPYNRLRDLLTHLARAHNLLSKVLPHGVIKTLELKFRKQSKGAKKASNNNGSENKDNSIYVTSGLETSAATDISSNTIDNSLDTSTAAKDDSISNNSTFEVKEVEETPKDGRETVICPSCPRVFFDGRKMIYHFGLVHHRKTLVKYSRGSKTDCGMCKSTYKRNADLYKHLIFKHKVLDYFLNNKSEDDCDKIDFNASAVSATMPANENGKSGFPDEDTDEASDKSEPLSVSTSPASGVIKMPKCPICQNIFFSRQNLIRHIGAKHNSEEIEKVFGKTGLECTICHRKMMSKPHLILHLMENHQMNKLNGKDKPNQIGSEAVSENHRASRKRSLDLKNETENGVRRIKLNCAICDSKFDRHAHLTTHVALIHFQTQISEAFIDDDSLVCRFCSKDFKSKSGMVVHMATIHRALNKFLSNENAAVSLEKSVEVTEHTDEEQGRETELQTEVVNGPKPISVQFYIKREIMPTTTNDQPNGREDTV